MGHSLGDFPQKRKARGARANLVTEHLSAVPFVR